MQNTRALYQRIVEILGYSGVLATDIAAVKKAEDIVRSEGQQIRTERRTELGGRRFMGQRTSRSCGNVTVRCD